MIFLAIIFIIFKIFIFLVENVYAYNVFALEIAFCCLIWIRILLIKLKPIFTAPIKETQISLNIYKLHRPKLRVFVVLLYLICFIGILLSLKIYRSAREVSLKQLYSEFLQFFFSLDQGQKVCTILFLLTLLYLAILLTKKLKNLIFKELIKVHLYFCVQPTYLDFICFPISLHCYMTLENAIVRFFRSKVKFLNKSWFFDLICFLVENLVLILILFFIIFDIYFNDFVLTKVFYILPPCFLYSQWIYLGKFYTNKNIYLDECIYKYLYTKIFFEDANIIMFEDGSTIDLEMRLAIDKYIEKGFRAY
jgi:hypothetical protein